MSIEIDRKNVGIYSKKYVDKKWIDKYKITKELYRESDLFELIVHREIKPTPTIYLTFKSGSLKINYTSFRFIDTNDLDKVEVYFSLLQPTIPLLVGIITNRAAKYYFASALKKLNGDISGKDLRISHEQLLDKLIEENNKQNNVITYRLDKKPIDGLYDGVEVENINHPSFDKYKHKPTGDLNGKTSYLLYKGKQLQLSGQSYNGSGRKLETIQKKCYCEIIVWYFKTSNTEKPNPPKYLELKEKNVQDCDNHNTYYLERSDHVGVSWTQIEDPKLDDVITYLLDKKPRNSEKYNDNSIEVKKSSNDSFEFYTHTPDRVHVNKKGYLRFNDKNLELVQNDHLGSETTRLDKFNGHTYCSVILYYYNATDQNQKPEFLELVEKNGTGDCASENQGCTSTSKCYLFQLADQEGISWKQIDYQDLKNTTIFRLECKEKNSNGYEKNVVSNGSEESFEAYTHTPIDSTKFGLFLYEWKILTLQVNDELPSGTTKLDKIQGKKYCKVCVYYSKLHSSEPPLYLKLVANTTSDCSSFPENSKSCDTACSNDYWLQRIDPNGHHWKQIKNLKNLSSKKPYELIEEIKENDKNSIMVRLTEIYEYPMSIIKNYRNDAVVEKINSTKKIYNYHEHLKNSTYKYFEHKFSESQNIGYSNIERLRLFIGNTEIKINDNYGQLVKLYYNPLTDTEKKIQVFFYPRDSVPLMLIWNNNPYAANKTDYFIKWKQIRNLIAPNPSDQGGSIKIKLELDKINKQFNEILLNNTRLQGYGISAPPSGQTPSGFSLNRVSVSISSATSLVNKLGKVTHTTSNKSSIGRVMLDKEELKNESGRSLLESLAEDPELRSTTFFSVVAYYHKTDSGYSKPLLLGLVKTSKTNPDVFYERQSVNHGSRWAKIRKTTELRSDTGIAIRVDKIRYTIGKSVKIMIDKQHGEGGSGSGTYNVELVHNTNGSGGHEPVDSGQITVTQNSSTTTQHTRYTCFTHSIPKNISTTSSEYVSGLRLYICQNQYLSTHDKVGSTLLPIYYDPNLNDVKVYFYWNNGGTSIENLDNVPLLAEYNDKHYKPTSRDEYFTKWVLIDGIDSKESEQITSKLDEINKSLNEVNLSHTSPTSYGMTKPKQAMQGLNQNFCHRVSVQRADKDHCYKKLIHSTTNKGPIGSVFLSGKMIHGIDSARLPANCNKVEVYYHTSDISYAKPLLIHISSQTNECSNNWYYRRNVEGTDWKHDAEFSKYNSENSIRDQLNKINAGMSNFLYLQIDQQAKYQIIAKSGSETQGNEYKAEIEIDMLNACSSYGPGQNYRCFKHQMADYYSQNKAGITRDLQAQEQPTLEVKVTIAGHQLILESSDGSSLPTQLTYGPTEQRTNSNAYVYFFEFSGETDKVPLLFMFGNQFFGPVSKDLFFQQWNEYNIDTHTGATVNITTTLNKITRLLNLIDLERASVNTYGDIESPSVLSHRPLGANKRVTVTRNMENGQDYHAVTHSTEKTGCVGTVYYQNYELMVVDNLSTTTGKPWSEAIEPELKSVDKPNDIYNELTAYYHITDSKYANPLVIKISGSSGSHTRVEDLYYERADKDDKLKWKKVGVELRKFQDGNRLADKINDVFSGFDQSVTIPLGRPPSNGHNVLSVVQNGGQQTLGSDPQTGRTASSLTPDHRAPSSIQSHQHTASTDDSPEQPLGQSAPGEHLTQEPHVKQQQQESQDPEASGHSTGPPTGQKTTPAEVHKVTMSDTGVGRQGDSSQGTGLAAGTPSESSPQELGSSSVMSGASGGSPADKSSEGGFIQDALKYAKENPGIVGGGGAAAGVGVIGTAGAVIYKKCIVGSAVAAGKAAAKVAASAASGM